MTLDLSVEQPADIAPEQPTAATIATFITIDGLPVRLSERPDGTLVIQPGSRNPLVLDRFQAGAMRAALSEAA